MFTKLGLVCILVAGANAAYSSSYGGGAGAGTWNGYNTYGAKYPYQQQSSTQYGYNQPGYGGAGGFVSTGTGTGAGGGFNGFQFAPLPGVPAVPTPYDYNQYVSQFLGNFANGPGGAGSSYAYSTPEATASAKTNLESNDLYQQQQQFFNNLQNQFGAAQAGAGSYGGAGYAGAAHGNGGHTNGGHTNGGHTNGGHSSNGGYGGGYAPNFAAATGTYGPGGVHQTASVYPSNPGSPNVDTRFGEDGSSVTVTSGQPGFVGVSTSSFSSSSDVNGQQQNHREAVTSVNDNGKVTTYRVRS